jgi:probable F420-dependent oxidoreductase
MTVQATDPVTATRVKLGPVGVWLGPLMRAPVADQPAAAQRLEELGYGSIFGGEIIGGKDIFASAAVVLAATSRIMFGTGIANIWCRHPANMAGVAATTGAGWPGRLIHGIGVSHAPLVNPMGGVYTKPIERMTTYLADMDAAREMGPETPIPVPRILAALGPRMLELSREHADGAHPFAVPPEHTPYARAIIGPDKLLITEQKVVLCTDPAQARSIARTTTKSFLPNYANNLRRFGYTDEDLAGGGSDRLVDALVAWGSEEKIAARVRDLLASGADHVTVQVIANDLSDAIRQLEELAPVLLPHPPHEI